MNDLWWQDWAKCRDISNADEIFFPKNNGGRGERKDVSRAKKICATCPVRDYCLMYAIAHKIPYGVWGGRHEGERKAIDRETKVRVRRVWFRKQLDIQLRGGEKLGRRDRSVRSVPRSGGASGTAGD